MRKILFRAKSKDNGEWTEGYYAMLGDEDLTRHFIVQNCAVLKLSKNSEDNMFFNDVEIDPETLCQYTGLKDKNGKRIWENDIIRVENSIDEGTGMVEFYGGMWYVDKGVNNSLYDIMLYDDEAEVCVMGNIFDNPELIRQTDI